MATAKKQASGNWKIRVYDYTDTTGKQHYKAFTARTKKEAERLALQWQGRSVDCDMTFGEAAQAYIDERRPILSPSTILGYASVARQAAPIASIKISRITQGQIQALISCFSAVHSPKTTRNLNGFISTVLKRYRPDFKLNTRLPQKMPDDIYIPTDDDIQKILTAASSDLDLYRAVLLAAYGPLRRSEICALENQDVEKGIAHVSKALVRGEGGVWHTKQPKTRAGDRYIPLPKLVLDALAGSSERYVTITPDALSERFFKVLKRAGVHHMRFHALRHYCASQLHALGMPDAYIMERGGWESDTILKQVYRHTLSDYAEQENARVNDILNSKIPKNMTPNMTYKRKKPIK